MRCVLCLVFGVSCGCIYWFGVWLLVLHFGFVGGDGTLAIMILLYFRLV